MIPNSLQDQIRNGNVILFLGAGASFGAVHPASKRPPLGQSLGKLIAEKFLGDEYVSRPLDEIAELAISESDLFTVQHFIKDIFLDFGPAPFHKLIPTFQWKLIATTNYDLVIERAYGSVEKNERVQDPIPFIKDGQHVETRIKSIKDVMYLKLHGCITNVEDQNTPLILTKEQYITHRENRSRLFEKFRSMAYECPILYVGHSLGDSDLRTIMLDLESRGHAKPRSYLVRPGLTDVEKRVLEGRKITPIDAAFEDFLKELNGSTSDLFRVLAPLRREKTHPLQQRYAVESDVQMSDTLLSYLATDSTFLHSSFATKSADPQLFYKGYFDRWDHIALDVDAGRHIYNDIVSDHILDTSLNSLPALVLIKGHAGSGKTVLMHRLAWDAGHEWDRLSLYANTDQAFNFDALLEIHSLCKERIFLFVDGASNYSSSILSILSKARRLNVPITVITSERHNEWNTNCEILHAEVKESFELKYLVKKEIKELLGLLSKHNSLGHLADKSHEEQITSLSKLAGRQLLVALHEATQGKPFSDIILDEYNSIASRDARRIYLTICTLHRLNVRVRAGVISRVHGISFKEFQERLFAPLDQVVFANEDAVTRNYYYQSRHPHIANEVFERVLTEDDDRHNQYINVLSALDTDYKSDEVAFQGMTKARYLLDLFSDHYVIRDIYRVASERSRDNHALLQQEAIFNMRSHIGDLDYARGLLEKAQQLAPYNKSITHTLSELYINQSNKVDNFSLSAHFLDKARNIATDMVRSSRSSERKSAHPYHTLLKIELIELESALEGSNQSDILDRINSVEKILTKAFSEFPNEEFILGAESQFRSLINDTPAAITALEKAYEINKRSPYIVVRLADIYQRRGKLEEAEHVLRTCLELDPHQRDIHYRLAKLLIKHKPDSTRDILYHLRRSFTKSDARHERQFWYARYLYTTDKPDDSKEYFEALSNANIGYRSLNEIRDIVIQNDEPVLYFGSVDFQTQRYGFIVKDGDNDRIYFSSTHEHEIEWNELTRSARVQFQLGFSYRGPVALSIRSERFN